METQPASQHPLWLKCAYGFLWLNKRAEEEGATPLLCAAVHGGFCHDQATRRPQNLLPFLMLPQPSLWSQKHETSLPPALSATREAVGTDRFSGLPVLTSTPQKRPTPPTPGVPQAAEAFLSLCVWDTRAQGGGKGPPGWGQGSLGLQRRRGVPAGLRRPPGLPATHHFLVHSTTSSW